MKGDKKDVGFIDDAIFYLQNMIAAETHALESYVSTKDEKWIDIAKKLRRNRSKRMYRLIPENQGELYCLSKHLLACSMALKELGNRYTEDDEEELAKECFKESTLYESLFKLLIGGKK